MKTKTTTIDSVKIEWNDDTGIVGCTAKAQISYPIGGGSRRLEWLTSGGLWGFEKGDNRGYWEDEQLSDLASHLNRFGIKATAKDLRNKTT